MSIRDSWRIVLLVLFITGSVGVLFAPPGVVPGAAQDAGVADEGVSNLKYGLQLSGGTRIRAPVVGTTAEDVNVPADRQAEIEQTVANRLNVSVTDVTATPAANGGGTIEVFRDVDHGALAEAIRAAGLQVDESNIRDGVTASTRDTMVRTIKQKINEAGFSGGRVQEVTTSAGGKFIIIEMPNANRSEVERLVNERGVVEIRAEFPAQNGTGTRNVTVLEQGDFASIGVAQNPPNAPPRVPVTLKQEAAREFQRDMVQYGFADEGIRSCNGVPEGQQYCLNTVVDGEVVYSADMSPGLARDFASGQFVNNPRFVMTAGNMTQARQLQINLRAGALPAPLDLQDRGTSYYISSTYASQYKLYSLLTGLAAALAVAGTVFVRYGNPKVAAPMFVTAISEVVILLGFAAAIQLPLDLSHIAGFIAVIGTGVDDLVIIADEVMAEGSVSSNRVFRSRFRKAFWIIGAAAATTIIAMSPLAVLSLGDLRGFAIITILGVLIGVLVTRPAYGDVLRNLLTDR